MLWVPSTAFVTANCLGHMPNETRSPLDCLHRFRFNSPCVLYPAAVPAGPLKCCVYIELTKLGGLLELLGMMSKAYIVVPHES